MSYLPKTDSGLLDWSRNLQVQLAALADPTTVGLTAQNVTDYTAAQADYAAKYAAAVDPGTHGTATVLAKNVSKAALVTLSRSYAMTITNYQGVTNAQRQLFGLTVKDTEPTPIPVPRDAPQIDVKEVRGRVVKLRLHDPANPERRGKPAGISAAMVFSWVGETLPPREGDWKFEGPFTRTSVTIQFPETVPVNSKVWFTSYWINPRGESGPSTTPVSTYLNREGITAEAA